MFQGNLSLSTTFVLPWAFSEAKCLAQQPYSRWEWSTQFRNPRRLGVGLRVKPGGCDSIANAMAFFSLGKVRNANATPGKMPHLS